MRRWSRRHVHHHRGSAERKHKSFHARIEKFDLELSIRDGWRVSDQLIQPRCGHRAVALVVHVNAVRSARRLSIEAHAKAHGSASWCRPHDEMQIAGVKAVHDPPVGLVQHRGLFPHCPITRQGPMIALQPLGGRIDATLVPYGTTWGRKVCGALIANIGFRRLQAVPIGGRFSTTGLDRNQLMTDAAETSLGQQLLNNPFRLGICAFAEVVMANMPLRIDDIESRPILVLERTPERIAVIDRDGIIDPHVLRRLAHVLEVVFKGELRRVHADHHQSVLLVFLGPRADIGQ